MSQPKYASYTIWSLDFIRALNELPVWRKLLLRVVFWKHAYSEFRGLVTAFEEDGWYNPFYSYGLENIDYHKDKQGWKWWTDDIYNL